MPAVITVTSLADNMTPDSQVTLREAIQAAETDESVDGSVAGSGADTITFAQSLFTGGPQTIKLGGVLPDLSGDITITGPGADQLTVRRDASDAFRIFTVDGGATVSLSGLTVANGFANGGGDLNDGGGIFNYGTLTVTGCTISGNSADEGGGISNLGTLTVTDSNLSGNSGSFIGGLGGAIHNEGSLTVLSSTIAGNSAASGGGISNLGRLTVTASVLNGNAAVEETDGYGGGAIFSHYDAEASVTNSTLSGNSAVFGGGIRNLGTLTVTNSTITDNSGSFGGGLVNAGSAVLKNTIVAGNTATIEDANISGTVDTANSFNNLIGTGGSGGLINGANGNQVGVADPRLGGLADNGGPTQTHALLASSPAINAGSNALVPAGLTTDQRGLGRVFGGTVDIGAYEARSVYTVDTLSDVDNGSYAASDLSLREAILLANANPGADTITFGGPVFTDATPDIITLTEQLPVLSSDVAITGPGANLLTVSGGGTSRIFDINAPSRTITISDLTLTNANPGPGEGGGAIRLLNGTLTISNSTISSSTSGQGGALAQYAGVLTIRNSTLSGNTAINGGALYTAFGTTTIQNSTISGNRATNGGGGVFNQGAALTLQNSTIAGNSAVVGGGVFSQGAALTLQNSTIAGNSAVVGGGVFLNPGAAVTLQSTIVAGNTATEGSDVNRDASSTLTASNSLIGDGSGSGLSLAAVGSPDANGNLVGTATNPIDPQLQPLAYNGGPTQTRALSPTSPALNMGSNPAGLSTDQRGPGFARIYGGTVDIGAYEVQNQTPTLSDFTLIGAEDNTLTFKAADFTAHFTDLDGDALVKVRIDSLPSGGVLKLNGTAVTEGQEIAAADLSQLVFVPNLNFSGVVAFQYNASDGSLYAASPATITLSIHSAQQQAQALDQLVQAMVSAGTLTSGQGEALSVNLRDNYGDVGKVQAFLNSVLGYINGGILTQDQAELLLVPGNILYLSVTIR